MPLIYNVLWRWSLYLNRCVAVSASEDLDDPGSNVPFFLNPILVELEGRRYVSLILPIPLADLLVGRRMEGGSGNGGGGSGSGGSGGTGGGRSSISGGSDGGSNSSDGSVLAVKVKKVGAPGGGARVRVRYNAHLPALSFGTGRTRGTFWREQSSSP